MDLRCNNHYAFQDIFTFISSHAYPDGLLDKGKKANFRRACKPFCIVDNKLYYNRKQKNGDPLKVQVVWNEQEVKCVLREIHEGFGDTQESKSLRAHHGIAATITLVSKRFYWRTVEADVSTYIKSCAQCQKVNPKLSNEAPKLNSVPVPDTVMKQIGVGICTLPEINGYKYLVVAIDYFSKWTEAKPLKQKDASSVAEFLYELITRHSCFDIQINDQGREFVNHVSETLHELTGVKQKVTSAYHPQANGLVERQNRTIKDKLLKILENGNNWVSCINGVLFAHRTAVHRSTGFSPFFLLYNREPKLPVDVQYGIQNQSAAFEFDEDYVVKVAQAMQDIRDQCRASATANIQKAQAKQQQDYNQRHKTAYSYKPGDLVLLKNLKRADRKGGKASLPWSGPFKLEKLLANNTCVLSSSNVELKKKQNLCNLKPFVQRSTDDSVSDQPHASAEANILTRMWIPSLGLTDEDKQILINNDWLNDRIVDAAQTLLRKQYPVAEGLDTTLFAQRPCGYDSLGYNAVQIHFDENRNHWFTSSTFRMRIEVADSMSLPKLTESAQKQLKSRYKCLAKDGCLEVYLINCDQQPNVNDCGLYSIANATEFLSEDGNPMSIYDNTRMRQHLIECLENGVLLPFPKSMKRKRGRQSTKQTKQTITV